MKKDNRYIQIIIFLSSFALLGFLVVQLYWAKNTFDEKKNNFHNLFEICVKEIGDELREKILNESNYFTKGLDTTFQAISYVRNVQSISNKVYFNGDINGHYYDIVNIGRQKWI